MAKKQYYLLLLIFLFSTSLWSYNSFSGIVVGIDEKPIEFATVYIEGQTCGTLTNTNGYFELQCELSEEIQHYLVISYLGYQAQKINVQSYTSKKKIVLQPKNFDLAPVNIIKDRNAKVERSKLKYALKKPRYFYQTNVESNYQIASRIKNPNQQSGYLSEIKFIVGKASSNQAPIRLNFYNVDEQCQCPGVILHNRNIIVNIKKGKNVIDLSPYLVSIPSNDFYLGLEWLHIPDKKAKRFDFSIGMIPVQTDFPLLEKIGGQSWISRERNSLSRVWTEMTLLHD